MDALTHVFLPLTVLYALRPALFDRPSYLVVGGVGLVPDLDKALGAPGLLHSLVTLVPLAVALVGVERWRRGRVRASLVVAALLGSHLCLDVLDGGPVPLLFPLVDVGLGLQYPVQVTFQASPPWLSFSGAFVAFRNTVPRGGYNTYGFLTGFGVASALAFAVLYAGDRFAARR
jgi:hypothetical protein